MNCEHCGEWTEHTYSKVPLCATHAAQYFPDTQPDGKWLDKFDAILKAAEMLGYKASYVYNDEKVLYTLSIDYDLNAVIVYNGEKFEYGNVTAKLYHQPRQTDLNLVVHVGGQVRGYTHPHMGDGMLCLDGWQRSLDKAYRAGEWERLLLLIYESACHYTPSGAYRTIPLQCSVPGHTHRVTTVCQGCFKPYCSTALIDGYCKNCCVLCACGRYARHVYTCSVCGAKGCLHCMSRCVACDREVCASHAIRCNMCGYTYCQSCMKGDTCHECIRNQAARMAEALAFVQSCRREAARLTVPECADEQAQASYRYTYLPYSFRKVSF